MKRRAALAHQLDDRLVDRRDELGGARGVDLADRRVGAHAAGVWAAIAVEDPLVVARRGHRDRALAVAEREQRELLALQVLLDDDRLACRSGARRGRRRSARARGGLVGGDHDALAGGEAVGLQHRRVALDRGEPLARPCSRASRRRSARRPPPSPAWRTPWSPRARAAAALGPNAATPRSRRRSARPATSGTSGPTTTRSTRSRCGERGQRVDVVGGDVEQPRVRRDAGVAGRAEQLGALRRAGERADERVLAAAGADDEDSRSGHARRSIRSRGEREGRGVSLRFPGSRIPPAHPDGHPQRNPLRRLLTPSIRSRGTSDITSKCP